MDMNLIRQPKNGRNTEQGTVLITALILLMLVTLAGIIAVSSSTVDTQIAGNSRRVTMALQGAEGGVNLAIPIIESTIPTGTLSLSGPVGLITGLDSANLGREIMGDLTAPVDTVAATPDITMASLGGVSVKTDVDWMYSSLSEGGASQFAMGYDGIGGGAGGGGSGALYRLNSEAAR